MFTGLIRELAEALSLSRDTLTLRCTYRPKPGDSIALNGVCLSVTKLLQDGFCVELSPETQNHIALERFEGRVHMEPAMMMGDRFEGHIVQGHIDAVGTVERITSSGNSFDVMIGIAPELLRYVVPKGSITVDGVSLTVNDVYEHSFRLTVIPITMRETLFHTYRSGTRVNIETDMFARYIEHLLSHRHSTSWEQIEHISALY